MTPLVFPPPIRLRLESDGTPRGTKVTNADTGQMIKGVQSITWDCAIGEPHATLRMEVSGVEVDAKALSSAEMASALRDIALGLG